MKREDIDVMEAKARAALEDLPEDVRAARWKVDASCRDVSASNPDSEDIQRWDIVKPVHGGVKISTLEHITASDPHGVLALIAELRRVEQERDVLAEVSVFRKKIDDAVMHALINSTDNVPYEEVPAPVVPSDDGAALVVEEVHLDEICGPGSVERAEAHRTRAQIARLVEALDPVRPTLRDLQRPAWDENEVARWGVRLSMTLAQARELAAACDAVDPEPPLRNAD